MLLAMLGILLSLAFLITMAYRGHSVVVIAPIATLIAVVFSWDHLLASYTQVFMPAAGGFIISFFPLFLAGAIFGRLMSVSGYAEDIARWVPRIFGPKRAILITAIVTALLTYGGVSAWVIAFTIVPIAKPLFQHANISLKLMPAAIALGIFTFATAALPGSPQIHNAIPTPFFNTTTFAAPILGIIGAVITFGLGMMWLNWRTRSLLRKGQGYVDISTSAIDGAGTSNPASSATDSYSDTGLNESPGNVASGGPDGLRNASTVMLKTRDTEAGSADIVRRGLIGLLPILVVVGVNAAFVYLISPHLDFDYLSEKRFGSTDLSSVLGTWSVTLGLVAAVALIFIFRPRSVVHYFSALSEGARNAVLPVFTTASEVGYGAVIASLAVFAVLQDQLFDLSDNPAVLGVVATAVISALTGSSSGGLSITMQTFGQQLAQMAQDQGISLDFLHRVVAMASVSLDSLPHNGAIVTLLLVCGLTHRQAYKDIGVVTVVVPFIGVIAVLALGLAVPALT